MGNNKQNTIINKTTTSGMTTIVAIDAPSHLNILDSVSSDRKVDLILA